MRNLCRCMVLALIGTASAHAGIQIKTVGAQTREPGGRPEHPAARADEGGLAEYSLDDLPAAWRDAATHMMMDVRFTQQDADGAPRFYVQRGDWDLDGREDLAVTMPGYCGNRCCAWYFYVATVSGTYRFMDSFFMGDAAPSFRRNADGDLEIVVPGCAPGAPDTRYVGSEHTGFEAVESGE